MNRTTHVLLAWVCLAVLLSLGCAHPGMSTNPTSAARSAATGAFDAPDLATLPPGRFAADIKRFVEDDRAHPPTPGGTLFVGSSTFERWRAIPTVFAEFDAANRAFGGSVSQEQLQYMDWIVIPRMPGKIVYYCGDNDLNAGATPEQVAADYQTFVGRVQAKLPDTKIYFLAIKFSPSRIRLVDNMRTANALVLEFTKRDPSHLRFIDINPLICDSNGQPKRELYVTDMLHFNQQGYDAITPLMKQTLALDR